MVVRPFRSVLPVLVLGLLLIRAGGVYAADGYPPSVAQRLATDGSKYKETFAYNGEEKWYTFKLTEPEAVKIELQRDTLKKDPEIDFYSVQSVDYGDYLWSIFPGFEWHKDRTRGDSFFMWPGTYYVRVRGKSSKGADRFLIGVTANSNLFIWDFSSLKNQLSTSDRKMTFQATCGGNPKEYRIGEDYSEDWKRFKSGQISADGTEFTNMEYKLSEGQGLKGLHLQVRDDRGFISETSYYNVLLFDRQALPVDGPAIKGHLDGHPASSDYEHWYAFTVTRSGDYRIELDHTIEAVTMQLYSADNFYWGMTGQVGTSPSVILLATLEPGNYFIEVGGNFRDDRLDGSGPYALRVASDDVRPVITSAFFNDGESETLGRSATLNFKYRGAPAWVMTSDAPDFRGASWAPFTSSTIPMTLSTGNGPKKVYIKFKDATGRASNVCGAMIYLNEPRRLVVNAAAMEAGSADGWATYFTFDVATAGDYSLNVKPGSIKKINVRLDKITPDGGSYIFGMWDEASFVKTATLEPGQYLVTIQGAFIQDGFADGFQRRSQWRSGKFKVQLTSH